MDSGESRHFREGNARDVERRRIVLDVDLNNLPPGELMDSTIYSGGQAASGAEVTGDDDVQIITPRMFEEATQNSRRRIISRSTGIRPDNDCLRFSDLSTNPVEGREFNLELGAHWNIEGHNRSQDIVTNTLVHPQAVPQGNSELESLPTFTCGICMDEIVEATSTKCGHIFCKGCIEAAIDTQHKCPSCRKKLRKQDTIRVHLPKSQSVLCPFTTN